MIRSSASNAEFRAAAVARGYYYAREVGTG